MNEEVTKSSPWDVFIHLLAVIALYVSVFAAISLLFDFANLSLPNPLDKRIDIRGSIRTGVSMLFVFFPVYWWAWSSIEADLSVNPGKRRLWVRTCPIYLTLFLAGLVALGDLAWLIDYLMSGDLTSRFVTKVVAVLLVIGAVLIFYRNALRREPGPLPREIRTFAYIAAAFAAALLVIGFLLAGPPSVAHLARLDQQRLSDLDSVQQKILTYWDDKGELPASIDQLKDDVVDYSPRRDPLTGDSYGYRRTGATSFDLCADFATKDLDTGRTMQTWRDTGASTAWNHEAGHYCFARTIDPALHPPKKSQPH